MPKIFERAVGGGGSATHVAHCNNIHPYFRHWCEVLSLISGWLFKMPKGIDAKRHSLLRLIGFSPLGERLEFVSELKRTYKFKRGGKFFSEFYKLRNFREGYNLKQSCRNSNSARRLYFLKNINYNGDMLHHDKNNKGRLGILAQREAAFTLAEVLITLGIIGIVAAMTLPSLITKYKIHELRTRFQKTNSIVNQALKYTLNDLGLSDYSDMNLFNLPNGSQASIYEPVYKEYNQVWEKQFKGAKKLGRQEILDNINPKHLSTFPLFTKTFWGEPADWGHLYATSGNLAPTYYLLPDGSLIGQIDAFGTCYASCTIATIFFDTNGPYKGPNRYGYDFFYFDAGIDGQSIFKCGINEANDRTCFYRYALRDQNPFNTSKTYWDNLYKPKSFFEK